MYIDRIRYVTMSSVPLIDLEPGVLYGTDDGGRTVYADPSFDRLMSAAADRLHLARHWVCNQQQLHSAGDVEGRKGKDGRYYVLDLSRTFPPESVRTCTHLPRLGTPEFYRMLRPEFLQIWKEKNQGAALNPDAYTHFSAGPDSRQLNRTVTDATRYLLDEVIVDFVDRFSDHVAEFDYTHPCSQLLHQHGINARHMGLIRSRLWFPPQLSFWLMEMLARSIKNVLRARLRTAAEHGSNINSSASTATDTTEATATDGRSSSETSLREIVISVLNLVSGSSKEQERSIFWTDVLTHLTGHFGSIALTDEERASWPKVALELKAYDIITYLLSMCHIQLSDSCLSAFKTKPAEFTFTIGDMREREVRVKYMR